MARKKTNIPPIEKDKLEELTHRLWKDWMRPHTRSFIILLLLAGVTALATGMYPILINQLIEAVDNKNMGFVYWAPFLVIAATALKGFSLLAHTILTNRVVSRIEADMQYELYAHMIDSDIEQIARHSPVALTQRFTTDFGFIREALTRLSTVFLRETLSALALVGVMLWIDWLLTLIAAIIIPVVALPVGRLGKRLRKVATVTQEQIGTMASMVSESLTGAKIAKTYELENYLKGKAHESFEEIRDLRIKSANAKGRLVPLMEIGAGVAVAGVFIFIGLRIIDGRSTIGDFAGFISALLLAAQPIRVLGNLHAALQEAMSAIQRFYSTIDEKPCIVNAPTAVPLDMKGGIVAFDRVSFRYREDQDLYALSDISFVAPAHQTTAFVGHSGSGKSTVLSLTARLYDIQDGVISIDGQDIRKITLHSLRQAVSIVTQDVMLFDDTIRNNIAFGNKNADEQQIIDAARAAAAHDFIMRLPDGYDTSVGVSGSRLSGGERQRISIARAFLKNAPILLLDEATSALDSESESLIQNALANLMENRTTLVVAHRLSTIKNADRIIVMEHGQIIESGSHDELMNLNGSYATMYNLQIHGEDVSWS